MPQRQPSVFAIFTFAFTLTACAEVAAPMPPEAPPTVRHQAESLPEEGQPPTALTAASDAPPPRAERPWLPPLQEPSPGEPTAGRPTQEVIESCLFELDPTLEPTLVAEALPAPPEVRLDEPEPCPGDAPLP